VAQGLHALAAPDPDCRPTVTGSFPFEGPSPGRERHPGLRNLPPSRPLIAERLRKRDEPRFVHPRYGAWGAQRCPMSHVLPQAEGVALGIFEVRERTHARDFLLGPDDAAASGLNPLKSIVHGLDVDRDDGRGRI
jgi:hypothetical protein